MRRLALVVIGFVSTVSGGCAGMHYRSTEAGDLSGKLTVEWLAPDCFAYRPHAEEPLTFIDSTGRPIVPEAIITDGGSIPRLLWSVPELSPWGYAPAYIVHDWIFEAHQCNYEEYTFEESARVMREVLKTLMESDTWGVPRQPLAMYAVSKAVGGAIARGLWDGGECDLACPGVDPDLLDGGGIILFELDFTQE